MKAAPKDALAGKRGDYADPNVRWCVCVCVAAGYGSAGDHSSITFQTMLRGVVPAKREAKQVAEKIMLGM